MEIKKYHIIGICIALILIGISFLFRDKNFFFLMIGGGFFIGISPFMLSMIYESKIAAEKEEMFLEFTRNLVESVKVGTPISKSVINLKDKPYGLLSENVKKLGYQISLGIPFTQALQTFSRDTNNRVISRALTLIAEAERAGGDIGEILEAVVESVKTSDKLKKERKATISTLVVQGYIIFMIFMVIILIIQFKVLPMLSGISGVGTTGTDIGGVTGIVSAGGAETEEDISRSFLYLLLIQGFFSGLTIGELSEGNIKAGLKHSFALMTTSFLVSAGANLFL